MSAIKEYYHKEICKGQMEAIKAQKKKAIIRNCANCAYNHEGGYLIEGINGCGESKGPDDTCAYHALPDSGAADIRKGKCGE